MKKRTILIVLMLVTAILLSACGKDEETEIQVAAPSIIGTWSLSQASGTINGQNYSEIMDLVKSANGKYTLAFKDDGTVTSAMLINGEVSFSSVQNYTINGSKITFGNSTMDYTVTDDTLTLKSGSASLKFSR